MVKKKTSSVVAIFETKLDNFYHSGFSDYWLHLYCYIHNVSVDMSSSFLQVNGITANESRGLNKGHGSKLCVGSRVRQEICPVDWGCRIHRLLPCRGVRPLTPTSVLYMTLNTLMVGSWGIQSTSSLSLLPGQLLSGLVAPDRALSMG